MNYIYIDLLRFEDKIINVNNNKRKVNFIIKYVCSEMV